jgi:hyaluronate lyase
MKTRTRISMIVVATVLGAGTLTPALPAAALDAYDTMRIGWVERLTGGTGFDATAAPYAAQVASITTEAQSRWDTIDLSSTTNLWTDANTATVEGIYASYLRVRSMALAAMTHGSALEGDPALLADTVAALDWLEANRYSATTTASGSWWHWEIGIPLELNETVVLLYNHLTATQVADNMAAVAHFTPSVTMTGANRVWKAMIVAGRGVLAKSSTALAAAQSGVVPALAFVATGDGFHTDGSFLQHAKYAYTGGYGLSLLANLVDLLALLDGSTWEVTNPAVDNVYDWVERSFDPLMRDGALMDTVRGREMSRQTNGEHVAGSVLMQTVLTLSRFAPPVEQAWLLPLVKQWIGSAEYRDFFSRGPLYSLVQGQALMADTSVTPRAGLIGAFVYPDMARVVQHRADYAFAIAMSSPTIANYESINGENRRGWYTGDGMTYLYTADGSQFSDDYWPTMLPYRVPGTTVDTISRTASSGAGYVATTGFAGGVSSTSGLYGAAAMSLDGWNTNLVAQKSWFLLDDEIVALGSGVTNTGQTGNGWDGVIRHVETVVDNRKLLSATQSLLVDGATVTTGSAVATVTDPDWAHLSEPGGTGEIGYVFPGTQNLKVLRQTRAFAWSDINTLTGSSSPASNEYVSMWFDHGTNPTGSTYDYVLLPDRTSAQTAAYAASPDVAILENSPEVHAVRDAGLGVMAATFWRNQSETVSDGATPLLTSNARASVIVEDNADGTASISVADPTMVGTAAVQIELHRSSPALVAASSGVTVVQLSPTIIISVAVSSSAGKPFSATFQ